MEQKSILIIRVKKIELSMSCQFYWCDIYFFRDLCKLPSVVNFDCDLSLIIDGVEVHYNYQNEKKKLSMSCQFYWWDIYFFRDVCKLSSVVNFDCDLSLIIDAAKVHYNFRVKKNCFVKIAECVTNIFFLDFLTLLPWKKCPNHSFFLFCACILMWYPMELVHDIIFFGFFDV